MSNESLINLSMLIVLVLIFIIASLFIPNYFGMPTALNLCDKVHILCALPERTYANDCVVLNIPEED